MNNLAPMKKPANPMKAGTPPFSHWWLTSTPGTQPAWRWYEEGKGWSIPVDQSTSAHDAGLAATNLADKGLQDQIVWCDYWPAGAKTKHEPIQATAIQEQPTPSKRVRLAPPAKDERPALKPVIDVALQKQMQAQLDQIQNLNPRG